MWDNRGWNLWLWVLSYFTPAASCPLISLTSFFLRLGCFWDLSGTCSPLAPWLNPEAAPSLSVQGSDEPIQWFNIYKHPPMVNVGSSLFSEQSRQLIVWCHLSFFLLTFIAQLVHITGNNGRYNGCTARVFFSVATRTTPTAQTLHLTPPLTKRKVAY